MSVRLLAESYPLMNHVSSRHLRPGCCILMLDDGTMSVMAHLAGVFEGGWGENEVKLHLDRCRSQLAHRPCLDCTLSRRALPSVYSVVYRLSRVDGWTPTRTLHTGRTLGRDRLSVRNAGIIPGSGCLQPAFGPVPHPIRLARGCAKHPERPSATQIGYPVRYRTVWR